MFNKKMQYIIKTVPCNDKTAMENLLNQMSNDGWELYTMHEIENDDSLDFNCIFVKEKTEENEENLDDIVNVTNFKYRMEKMLSTPTSPYESCKEILLKIATQKERIKKIKEQLDSDNLSTKEKKHINEQMSDELLQLNSLKQSLISEISPSTMYSNLKEEKFVVQLSDELLELISLDNENNLLAETVKVRQKLSESLGYVIPHIYFHNSDELSQYEFRILIHDVEVFRDAVFPNYIAYYKEDLKGYKLQKENFISTDYITEKNMLWIPTEKASNLWAEGYTAIEYIARAIEHIAIKEVADIMDYNDINNYIEIVLKNNSFLIDNIIPDYLTIADLKYLLTSLIREQVSIKNINYLFEKINDYANEPSKEDLLDRVRLSLSKSILKDLAKDGDIQVLEFSDGTLDIFSSLLEDDENSSNSIIRIDSGDIEHIIAKINKQANLHNLRKIILSVPMEIRHMTFIIMSEYIPQITVLAQEELVAGYNINYVAEI